MPPGFQSTLLLTLLLAIGLAFFIRAASKDRTTLVDIHSSKPPLEVLNGINIWLKERGWNPNGGDANLQLLRFRGKVAASKRLAVLLSFLAAIGAGCFGLVLKELIPELQGWPLLLVFLGPLAGVIYSHQAARIETLELKLLESQKKSGCLLRIRGHRDELIALELELAPALQLESDGKLMSSPI